MDIESFKISWYGFCRQFMGFATAEAVPQALAMKIPAKARQRNRMA